MRNNVLILKMCEKIVDRGVSCETKRIVEKVEKKSSGKMSSGRGEKNAVFRGYRFFEKKQ